MTPVETVDAHLGTLRDRYIASCDAYEMDLALELLDQIDDALDRRNAITSKAFVPWIRKLLA
jgi:hypothetical protein